MGYAVSGVRILRIRFWRKDILKKYFDLNRLLLCKRERYVVKRVEKCRKTEGEIIFYVELCKQKVSA